MEQTLLNKIGAAAMSMKNPKLNKVNPHFKSKYATLDSVQAVVQPALARNGLFDWVTFNQESSTWDLTVTDGQDVVVLSSLPSPGASQIQGVGSEATYAGRYLRCNAYFLVGEEDDDGNAAVEVKKQGKGDYLAPVRDLMDEYAGALGLPRDSAARYLASSMEVDNAYRIPAERVQEALDHMHKVIGG